MKTSGIHILARIGIVVRACIARVAGNPASGEFCLAQFVPLAFEGCFKMPLVYRKALLSTTEPCEILRTAGWEHETRIHKWTI